MDEQSRYDVIIAGGGFVGLTLALALAKLAPAGLRVALIDAEPAGASAGGDARASALSAATRRLLTVLGVWPQLADVAQPITSIEVTDSPLNVTLRPHMLGFDHEDETGDAGASMVENRHLAGALHDAVAAEATIKAFAADSAVDFRVSPFGVTVALASGVEIEGGLLVAADGKRSRLRERAGIKCVGWSYLQMGIVTTVAHTKPHHGRAVQHFLPDGPFAILPLKGNRSSIVWSEDTEKGEAIMAADEAGFVTALGRRFGHALGDITLAGSRQSFRLDLQIARRFAGDRLVLIGDAAHAVHPVAGQGLNIGMRDVAALAEILVEGVRIGLDAGTPSLLERYERWRRFDSAFSAAVMDGLNRFFSNNNAPLRALRDLGLGLVDRAPQLKRFLVREAAGDTGEVPRLLKGERV
jgi:2-octaprenyl-6-methoxyphenol hydroxylase